MDVAPPPTYPREGGSPVSHSALMSEGPQPFYPPVCLKTHWDPTQILKRTLPSGYVAQALDPRPWTRICMEYSTTGDNMPAPKVGENVVLPSGGQFYPASRYSASIDNESKLRGLDRPLGTCEADQYVPPINGDMFTSRRLLPDTPRVDPSKLDELSFPRVLVYTGPYKCRAEQDTVNMNLSDRMFFNATKQDRYKLKGRV
jgi:hypothetical protein